MTTKLCNKLVFSLVIFVMGVSPARASGPDSRPHPAYVKAFNQVAVKADIQNNKNYSIDDKKTTATTATLYSIENKKYIELTILSIDRARDLFKTLKNDEENTFDAPLDACFGRAHRMAQVMDEQEIISGKAFIEGDLYIDTKFGEIGWTYHVSSLVMVKDKNKVTPMIMDPTFFEGPVSVADWEKKFTLKSKSKVKSIYFNRRFSYDIRDKDSDLVMYDEDQIEDAKRQIKENRRKVDMLEYMEKKK